AEVERPDRLAHTGRIREAVDRVAALDDDSAEPRRVVGEDRIRDRRGREHAADDPLAGDGRTALGLAVAPDEAGGGEGRVQVRAAGAGEVAGQRPEQLLEVAVEGRGRRLLDAEVLEDRNARRRAD